MCVVWYVSYVAVCCSVLQRLRTLHQSPRPPIPLGYELVCFRKAGFLSIFVRTVAVCDAVRCSVLQRKVVPPCFRYGNRVQR